MNEYNILKSAVWRYKLQIAFSSLLFASLALIIGFLTPEKYRSSALLAPSSSSMSGGFAGMAGQLGGLASLAGINLGGDASQIDRAIATAKTRYFVNQFIEKNELLPILLAVKSFNKDTGSYYFDNEIYNEEKNEFTAKFLQDNPTYLEEAYEEFVTKVLGVSKDNMTGFVSISIKLTSPELAKELLDQFISDLSALLKERDIENTSKHITYLDKELDKVTSSEVKVLLYQIQQQSLEKLSYIKTQSNYLFDIIEPPYLSEKPVEPKKVFMVVLGGLLGLIFGALLSYIIYSHRKND